MKASSEKKLPEQIATDQQIKRRTFVAFSIFAGANLAAFGAWKWLRHSPLEKKGITGGVQTPLRQALNKSESVFKTLFSDGHLVKTYPKIRAARNVRKNGNIGLKSAITLEDWKLHVQGLSSRSMEVDIAEIKSLPKTELIFDFKCVEGWDQIQHWGGVRFSDFMKQYGLDGEAAMKYVGMETPDNKYYVGLDMESALHPQTLLAYEMNGRPLILPHGAPLRLIVPVKYGIKNLKRIGKIFFSNQRPRDYWAENGYDYYAGL